MDSYVLNANLVLTELFNHLKLKIQRIFLDVESSSVATFIFLFSEIGINILQNYSFFSAKS